MRRFQIFILLIFGAAFLSVFCGCTLPEEVLRYKPQADDSVRIGLVLPLSGADAVSGRKMLNGARFAVEGLNSAKGHLGKRVELLVEDSRSSASGAAEAFKKVVDKGAIGVVGGYSTVEAKSISGLAKTLRVPLVIAMATGNNEEIGSNPFVFRVTFTDRQQAEMIAGYMKYYRRVNRIVLTVSADPADIYSRNVSRGVGEAFKELGGEVFHVCRIDQKEPQKSLKETVNCAPDAVVLPFKSLEAARYYKILRELGYQGLICGPDSWDDPQFVQALGGLKRPGNNFYTAFFSNEARHIEFSLFWKNFRKKAFYYPGSCEIQTFDAVNMLLTGFGNNGSTLRIFKKNWLAVRKHGGAAAIYTMKPENEIDRTIYINRIGVNAEAGNIFVPRNLSQLQYSRLGEYNSMANKDEKN